MTSAESIINGASTLAANFSVDAGGTSRNLYNGLAANFDDPDRASQFIGGATFGMETSIAGGAAFGAVNKAVTYDSVASLFAGVEKTANPYLAEGAEFSIRINPSTGRGPMAIDTSTFTSGKATANGGIRNARQFWQAWADQYGSTLSPENMARIQARTPQSPIVDEQWLQSFPEHSAYDGETLIHHHLDYGPNAIPLPDSAHRFAPGQSIWHQ